MRSLAHREQMTTPAPWPCSWPQPVSSVPTKTSATSPSTARSAGSWAARRLSNPLAATRPEQVHILEMVGFTQEGTLFPEEPRPMVQCPDVADFLGLVGTHQSRHILDHVLACAGYSKIPVYGLYLPERSLGEIRLMAPHVFRSDHDPFWCKGIPALMWTDTAEFRNPNYHQPTDTPDTLDYGFMAEVTRLLIHSVLSWLG